MSATASNSATICNVTTLLPNVDRLVQCEREHGHGGAHRAEITDYDEDFIYVVSWWPTPAPEHAEVPAT